jgi:hypothetical protein
MIKNEQIDGNKEMIAFGMMNIVGSFTSCYLTTGIYTIVQRRYVFLSESLNSERVSVQGRSPSRP